MIEQAMGGDLVYIVSKNAFFAGPNNVAYGASKADQAHQVRLLAAELGAVRHPGQRRQPRRRRPRLRDLRQGLGRRPGADLRHPRGQARRVLRAADAAQARGPARARRGGGLRADRRRPEPDDRAAHPGRRRGRGRVPAVTRDGPARRAVDLGASSGRVIVGRVGAGHARARRGPPLPERARSRCPTACTGTSLRLSARSSTACGAAGRAAGGDLASVGGRHVGDRLRAARRGRGARSASRSTTATRADRAAVAARPRRHPARARCTRGPAPVPAVQHDLPAGRRSAARPAFAAAGPMLLIPDLIGYWLTGVRRGRGDERLDDRRCSTSRTRDWATDLIEELGLPRSIFPPIAPAGRAGRCPAPRGGRRRPGLAGDVTVGLVGSHDTASAVVGVPAADDARSRTSRAGPGRSSASSSTRRS